MPCLSASSHRSSSRSSHGWKDALRAAVLRWTLILVAMLLIGLATASASGCGSRTVLVSEGSPIRTGPDTRARVYSLVDGEWVLSANDVHVPEGWYLVPPSFVEAGR